MSQITPFTFNNYAIRTATDNDGTPWFVAKDMAELLGYSRTNKALELCKHHTDLVQLNKINDLAPATKWIPESDVYRLIMRSMMPKAVEIQDWVTEEVLPSIRRTGSYSTAVELPTPKVNTLFRSNLSVAKLIFKDKNQALLSANRATITEAGVDVLERFGAKALPSEHKESLVTASDIGKHMGTTGQQVNTLLEQAGLHVSYRDAKGRKCWQLTEQGMDFAEELDTGKRYGDGTPVKQIKWKFSTIGWLRSWVSANAA